MENYNRGTKISKSLSRDMNVILKIIDNVNNMRELILKGGFDFSNTEKGIINNKFAFDLCSFYISQIGEKVKLLTDATVEDLGKVFDIRCCVKFRNLIDHDYEHISKKVLVPYVQMVTSNDFLNALHRRYDYCKQNKRNS